MRKIVVSIVLSVLFAPTLLAQYSKVENINIESKELDQSREIMVYTPLGYKDTEYAFYNVIYVFDAQNRMFFDFVSSLATLSRGDDTRGFIVVGIKAKDISEVVDGKRKYLYFRNLDLLPEVTDFFGGRYKGNSSAFFSYVKNEVIPYVESNYRILPNKLAIGHSLSASFLLSAFAKDPNIFDGYVAVSPNFDYDNEKLIEELRAVDPDKLTSTKHLYVSHANEGNSFGWQKANEHAYPLLRDTLASANLKVTLESYPEETHNSNFVTSVLPAMKVYQEEVFAEWNKEVSEESYEVTFRLKVLDEEDEVFITGNQTSLGNWETDQIKMTKESALVRSITLEVHDHAEVAFYKEGKSQAWLKYGEEGRTTYPMMIKPEEGAFYDFEVYRYNN